MSDPIYCKGCDLKEKKSPMALLIYQSSKTYCAPHGFNGYISNDVYWCEDCGTICFDIRYSSERTKRWLFTNGSDKENFTE